jgi:ABC-type nitrate/sulfonate/bicarbonate transport system substrate-binding protein
MKPVHFFIIAILVSGVVISGCVSQPQTKGPEMTTVKVAYLPLISNAPLFIAKDEGYFARQGINVEFEKFQSGAATLPALINGDIAVSGGALSPGLFNAIAKDAHIRIVADKGSSVPGACIANGLVVRRDLFESKTIRNVSDLKGRKVMASSDQDFSIFHALAFGNLTTDDIEVVNLDYPSGIIALKNGAVDAAVLVEPYITQAVSNETAVVLIPASVYSPYMPFPLYYGPAFLDKDPDLGRRFMVGYLRGVKQYNEGKTEHNLAIVENYTHLNRDLLEQTCWLPIAKNGTVIRQPVMDYVNWLQTNKKINQKPDEDQIFDMSYVTYADTVVQDIP